MYVPGRQQNKRLTQREKFIDHKKKNKRCDNQNNKLMWQAASEEIPIQLAAHANTNYTILYVTQRNQTIKPNQSNILKLT